MNNKIILTINKHHSVLHKIFLLLLLLSTPQTILAETLRIPLKIDFPHLQKIVIGQLFTEKDNSKELLQDPNGCSKIILSDPKLSESKQHLQINTHVNAHLAIKMIDRCVSILDWEGYSQIFAKPAIKANDNRLIYLQVIDSQLFGLDNKLITSGALWDQAKQYIHPFFGQFQYDLSSSIDELKNLLPLFLARQPRVQLDKLLNSLHLENIKVTQKKVEGLVVFDVETIPQSTQREKRLTPQEQQQWEKKWQSMDAFLTQTIKYYASATELEDLRLALFDILIDARFQLQDVLLKDHANDPVRHWFIESWSKLVPLIEVISEENSQHSTTTLITLITASDALKVMDKLGPSIGLDISIDGLRRLARLLNNNPIIDPLNYDNKQDPQLKQLFQLNFEKNHHSQSYFNLWPIHSALAMDSLSPSNSIPNASNLEGYLLRIRKILLKSANQLLEKTEINKPQQEVFEKLVMATAWQESCWRQYVIKNKKIVPLRSTTGDTGIMQVNEKVWRGFVDIQKLRWDVVYNIQTGSNILLDYMTRYAIKKKEDQYRGGLDNLARSAYSTYNGGPVQVARYRIGNIARDKKVDKLFYDKYLAVKQGKELAVAECLGGKSMEKSNAKIKKADKQSPTSKKRLIHGEAWVKQQPKSYFTIQLGAFSSNQLANSFIEKQNKMGNYAVYKQQSHKSLYIVIYGRYSSHSRAKKEIKFFKRVTPWVRQFKEIRSLSTKTYPL